MKVIKLKKVEDCFESSNTRDIVLSSPLTVDFVNYLGKLGKLLLFDDFDIPYFKVIVKGEYTIKGTLGKKTIRILLPEDIPDYSLDSLVEYINSYSEMKGN